jgi:hypothetical protein
LLWNFISSGFVSECDIASKVANSPRCFSIYRNSAASYLGAALQVGMRFIGIALEHPVVKRERAGKKLLLARETFAWDVAVIDVRALAVLVDEVV